MTKAPGPVLLGIAAFVALAGGAFAHALLWPALAFAAAVALLSPEAGLVALVLALPTLPLVEIGGPLADARVDELLAPAIVASVAARCVLRREWPRTGLALPMAAVLGVSAAYMVARGLWPDPVPAREYLLPLAKHAVRFALFLSAVWIVRGEKRAASRVRGALIAGANAGGLLALGQVFVPAAAGFVLAAYPSIRGGFTREFYFDRAFAAFDGNPNHLGAGMLLAALIALAPAARAKTPRARWSLVTAAVVPMCALVASGSRAAWVVAAVTLGVTAWFERRTFGLALAAFAAYTFAAPNAFVARLPALLGVRDERVVLGTSAAGKVEMASGATAHGSLVVTDDFYLDVLYNYSALALAAWAWLLAEVARPVARAVRRREDPDGSALGALLCLAAVTVLSVQGAFFAVARVSETLWVALGLAWGILPYAYADGARTFISRLAHRRSRAA